MGAADFENAIFVDFVRKTEKLTDEQWLRGFAECERHVVAAERNGETDYPPSTGVFVVRAKKGNAAPGIAGVAQIDYHSPDHPRFDPGAAQYCGHQHPDTVAKLANPNAGNAITGAERHKRGNAALDSMHDMLKTASNRGRTFRADSQRDAVLRKEAKVEQERLEEREKARDGFEKRGYS